ncbi:acylphosphatase domain-containing protein [Hirsutella rhossiliensis]|uniref:acylphosphatase n=1 Tax=Hirsutella rhossiliensis TaxID=111463 RepID=A0A9P8N288_9HYPO|nr:acylphosphatase domain-containing protein [Hirsutella rhossiliensis]KAH0963387.1 acylphosphatase domain-containing protein [Hirsutella rhossiliensis]
MARRSYFVAHGGVVQGVGFRFFAKQKAQEHGITGWCRNTPDNKVEGEAQGEHDALETFLKEVGQGPAHAKVVQFTTEDRGVADGESGFSVRH